MSKHLAHYAFPSAIATESDRSRDFSAMAELFFAENVGCVTQPILPAKFHLDNFAE